MQRQSLSRYIAFLLSTVFCLQLVIVPLTPVHAAEGTRRTFRLSAYYSPEPGQSFYAMGSYEAELRMNGKGISGASGVAVYPGMLAAPKSYAFGTKIHMDGLGVGTVWDRGGAIVQAGERGESYDRIDVWMGRGEEGLKRALTFGKRTVTGTVYLPGTGPADSLNLSTFPILPGLGNKKSTTSTWSRSLHPGVSGADVHKLQEALQTLGFFKETPTGNYGTQTETAVVAFQQAHRIIQTRNDHGAGVFGPSTRQKLEEVLKNPALLNTPAPQEPEVKEEEPSGSLHAPIIVGNSTVSTPLSFGVPRQHLQTLATHSIFSETELVQYELRKRNLYTGEITGDFDNTTRKSLIAFQLKEGIITEEDAYGAGTLGPQTKAALAKETVPVIDIDTPTEVETTALEELQPLKNPTQEERPPLPMMAPGDSGEYVVELQKALTEMQLYKGAHHGVYDEETEKAILYYQMANKLINDPKETGAGYFGPKTSAHFNGFVQTPAIITGGRPMQSLGLSFGSHSTTAQRLQHILDLQ